MRIQAITLHHNQNTITFPTSSSPTAIKDINSNHDILQIWWAYRRARQVRWKNWRRRFRSSTAHLMTSGLTSVLSDCGSWCGRRGLCSTQAAVVLQWPSHEAIKADKIVNMHLSVISFSSSHWINANNKCKSKCACFSIVTCMEGGNNNKFISTFISCGLLKKCQYFNADLKKVARQL